MPTFRIIHFATFATLMKLVNLDQAMLQAFAGNLEGAWNTLVDGSVSILSNPAQRGAMITALLTSGAIEYVARNSDLQRSFTVGNFTIGV